MKNVDLSEVCANVGSEEKKRIINNVKPKKMRKRRDTRINIYQDFDDDDC